MAANGTYGTGPLSRIELGQAFTMVLVQLGVTLTEAMTRIRQGNAGRQS